MPRQASLFTPISPNLSQAEVRKRLARKITDAELRRIFPQQDLALIRQLICPQTQKKETPAPPKKTPANNGGHLRLFTDGASRGNPGLAGAGYTVDDGQGQELLGEGIFLGKCTNNVAEYQALIKGLQAARALQPEKIDIFLDSQLIVRQIQGQYKVKNNTLKPLFAQVQQLLNSLPAWQIHHVPREQNKRADELANEGIDSR